MIKLSLRRMSHTAALARLTLGRGRVLECDSGGEHISITLSPLNPCGSSVDEEWMGLSSRHGPLLLTQAGALLSLCGELPVVTAGPRQAWYWQLINQQLAPVISELLAPLEPLADVPTLVDRQDCRVLIERGGEKAYGVLSLGAESLLQLLDHVQWRFIERAVPGHWGISHPVVVGRLDLSINQLRSLRPGDVLLPVEAVFDVGGRGQLSLGNRQWRVDSEGGHDQLQLRLIHEEGNSHGQ